MLHDAGSAARMGEEDTDRFTGVTRNSERHALQPTELARVWVYLNDLSVV
jgi:hypothetical protein